MNPFRLLEPEYIEGTGTDKYRFFNNGGAGAIPIFAQFLKDSKHPKYSIAQINDYPTTTYAVQIITTLMYAWASDSVLNGDRLPPIVFGGVCFPAKFLSERRWLRTNLNFQIINIICYISLAIWDIPEGWRWTCYILSGAGFGLSGLCMAYVLLFLPYLLMLRLTARLVGLMKFVPTTTKSELLSWRV